MHTPLLITVGAVALAVAVAPTQGFARDDESIARGEQGSATHGVHGTQDGGMAKTPTTAAEFVKHAGQGGMAEVSLGKMAVTKATDADVKEFAQRMVDDHSKANDELKSLATSKGLQVPTDVDAKQKALSDRLSKLSGPAFDKAYMQAMVSDHDHDVALFRTYSERGDDPEIKQWAGKTLPTLQEHERLAKTTATKVGANERMGKHNHAAGSKHAQR
jgi:putative membrane protein